MLHFANTVSLPMRLKPLLSRMSTQVPSNFPYAKKYFLNFRDCPSNSS